MAWPPEQPEDFLVDEIPLYPACGEGEHTFVRVEKRLRTTEQVARDLARAAGVRPAQVGYAGRKDRVAVATQWLSVPGLDPECARRLEMPGVRVLEAVAHRHKLRTGQLRGNRFRVRLRSLRPGVAERAVGRLEWFARHGAPNRFGPQRFGRDGANAERGLELLARGAPLRDRRQARFLISALQAAVFNRVLEARPRPLSQLELGDLAVVHASGGLFRVEDLEREAPRAAEFEISATGPIFGSRMPEPGGAVAERERAALADLGLESGALPRLAGVRLRGGRRPLRFRPSEARAEAAAGGLQLDFCLPSGSFASVLVDELIRDSAALGADDSRAPRGLCWPGDKEGP